MHECTVQTTCFIYLLFRPYFQMCSSLEFVCVCTRGVYATFLIPPTSKGIWFNPSGHSRQNPDKSHHLPMDFCLIPPTPKSGPTDPKHSWRNSGNPTHFPQASLPFVLTATKHPIHPHASYPLTTAWNWRQTKQKKLPQLYYCSVPQDPSSLSHHSLNGHCMHSGYIES